jgi:hypothetical protein
MAIRAVTRVTDPRTEAIQVHTRDKNHPRTRAQQEDTMATQHPVIMALYAVKATAIEIAILSVETRVAGSMLTGPLRSIANTIQHPTGG